MERPKCGTDLQALCLAESEVEEGQDKLGVVTARTDQDRLAQMAFRPEETEPGGSLVSPLHSKESRDSRPGSRLFFTP